MTSPEVAPTRARTAPLPKAERVRLRDGSWVTLRAVHATDEGALRAFLDDLCLEARRLRFFGAAIDMTFAAHLGAIEDTTHYGLLARDEIGAIVGHATYVRLDRERAEVAVEVADHLHGRGLGTILIERLAADVEQRGITRFVAEVLCENRAMLGVFRDGFDGRVTRRDGPEQRVELLTSSWRDAQARFAAAGTSSVHTNDL
ncbi:MAG TPA: GNAT family N-acetyltransferase [Solirubrobacteraceae bacterium]|jgi:GNAT superfamily N-acetyltransferase|nr:GNAT family N-acetyltransferase [Solirubrobacteraceae bacterium]